MNVFTQGHALIIGVGADLSCTVDDANDLANVLKDPERCAYPSKQVRVLTEASATRHGILSALDNMAKTTAENSTLIIYFSGHGHQGKDKASYYLIPNDCHEGNFPAQAIKSDEFAAKIRALPAAKKIIFLDCCHADGVGSGSIKGFGLGKSRLPDTALSQFKQGSGSVLIASSRADEKSYTGTPYSVFTGTLIEALCGQGCGAMRHDGYVQVSDLVEHVHRRVPGLTEEKQHPVLDFTQADNFTLAYYAGGNTQAKALSFELTTEFYSPPTVSDSLSQLILEIKQIKDSFVDGDFLAAFTRLYELTDKHPLCGKYRGTAIVILSEYNQLENAIMNMELDLTSQEQKKRQIKTAFLKLIGKMEDKFGRQQIR